MEAGLLISVVGVAIAIVFFFVTDRKTIGAKREKINSIYNEIVKTLFRSVIHDGYIPSIEEIDRMLSTKCAENELKISSFPEPLDFINTIYTKIMQDDVLEGTKKKSLIKKVNLYIKTNSEKTPEDPEEKTNYKGEARFRFTLMMMSSVLAVIITFFTTMSKTNIFSIYKVSLLFGTFIAATVSIMALSLIKRYREENIITKLSQDRYKEYKSLESNMSKMLKKFNPRVESSFSMGSTQIRPDFEFKNNNKNYFIEIKSFAASAPRSSIHRLVRYGNLIKNNGKNNITVLVVNNKRAISPYTEELSTAWDYIFNEEEFKMFRNSLAHKK